MASSEPPRPRAVAGGEPAYYADDTVTLYGPGDCRNLLANVAEGSVDAIVTDPPYEYGFMGKDWDSAGVAFDPATWAACLRVLKPGGHLLAFGGTRTYHRMVCAIEDAGFEIRDSMHWIYGSGFPKGQDIAKVIDRHRDDRAEILQVTAWLSAAVRAAGWTNPRIDALFGFNGMSSHWTAIASRAAAVPTPEQWDRLRDELSFDDHEIRPLVAKLNGRKGALGETWAQREVIGRRHSGLDQGATSVFLNGTTGRDADGMVPITAPASDEARRWQGWNTTLKPAHEPIVVARKSTGFDSAVANVLRHGTGALNIDACRTVAGQDYRDKCASVVGLDSNRNGDAYGEWTGARADSAHAAGRWPTNVVLSHQPLVDDIGNIIGDACAGGCVRGCPIADLDAQSGIAPTRPGKARAAAAGTGWGMTHTGAEYHDVGGASRFFPVFRYEAKAPASERPRSADGTAHATVKPLALIRWLTRLVTQAGGLVCDPFLGSGTTAEACIVEGFRCIGVELDAAHLELVTARLSKPIQPTLGDTP